MRIIFCGDIVGRSGREAVSRHLPELRQSLTPDFVIANGENAAGGFGITAKICQELFSAGVDVITGGNHSWDQREILSIITSEKRLLRPINFPASTPGRGFGLFTNKTGKKLLVVNVMGRLFMDPLDDPFCAVDEVLARTTLGKDAQAILVDFHAEATSEKMALAHYLDGRVSLVVGTHTHVPTADAQILDGGTAYQSDAGMCGDYNSVIGMDKTVPIQRFTRKLPTERLSPADGEGSFCGLLLDCDPTTGLAKRLAPIRLGPRLLEALPA